MDDLAMSITSTDFPEDKIMRIAKMHEEQLRQLTGCRYSVIATLRMIVERKINGAGPGAPFRRSIMTMLVATLIRLRGGSPYRSLAVFLQIPYVTLRRYTNLVCALLADLPLAPDRQTADHTWLMVDSTCTRVRSAQASDYSGYKHHKNRKVQIITDDRRRIVAVSAAYSGAVHDKTIWNKEFEGIEPLIDRPVLADKAYAGGKGENVVIFRPTKRNEVAYRTNMEECRRFNRELSRQRVTIEHVFADLKTFRIIRDIFPLHPDQFGMVFKAVAFIHNVILSDKEQFQSAN